MQYYFQAFPDPPHCHKLTQAHPGSHERRELAQTRAVCAVIPEDVPEHTGICFRP